MQCIKCIIFLWVARSRKLHGNDGTFTAADGRMTERQRHSGGGNPATVVVRRCEDHDVTAVREIYAHHVRYGLASFEIEPPSREEMAQRRRGIVESGLPYLVAEERDGGGGGGSAGVIVGYAYAGPYRPRPAYRFTVENSVYVRADRARRGIGRMLLEALIADCEAQGYRQMIAVIGDSANRSSIGLHESLGFRTVGVLQSVGFKHGRWVDVVQMQRELGVGDRTLLDDAT
jgi:phosphinothricin acetyltransferase